MPLLNVTLTTSIPTPTLASACHANTTASPATMPNTVSSACQSITWAIILVSNVLLDVQSARLAVAAWLAIVAFTWPTVVLVVHVELVLLPAPLRLFKAAKQLTSSSPQYVLDASPIATLAWISSLALLVHLATILGPHPPHVWLALQTVSSALIQQLVLHAKEAIRSLAVSASLSTAHHLILFVFLVLTRSA